MKLLQFAYTAVLSIFLPVLVLCQSSDTMYVPAEKENGDYYINSLIDFVEADTNASGEQLHKVYKLERGKLYLLDDTLKLKNAIEIVAEPPVPFDNEKKPPKILSNVNEKGETATQNLIIAYADITIKNIWLSGIDIGGVNNGWGMCGALFVKDSLVTVTLDGIWCDFNSWSAFGSTMPHTRWHINNFHARNEQNAGDQWTTILFYLENSSVVDTFIITNSSYFQSNSFFLFPPRVVKYLQVDHCTFVNTFKWPFHEKQWLNAKFTNSIFYNTGALSRTDAEMESSDPDPEPFSIINIDTLSGNKLGGYLSSLYTIPEKDRVFIVKNNIYFFSKEIEDYWTENDSVNPQLWMNDRTKAMCHDSHNYPNFEEANNWNVDPKFDDFPGLTEADNILAQACTDIRAGNTHGWDWDSDMKEYPDSYKLYYSYPLPEYFKSYAGKIGTDGLPVGDLTYYSYDPPTGIKGTKQKPFNFTLYQNFPNPFNPSTIICYQLATSGYTSLKIYDILGREVKTFLEGERNKGNYNVIWDGTNNSGNPVGSGIYICRIYHDRQSRSIKLNLIK